jgi:branched-chain amino acid transport system permease protein
LPLAAIYAICAFAWVILYRTTGVLNMATGASMVLGAFCFNTFLTDLRWSWFLATAATVAVTVLFGVVIQFGVLRRLAGQSEFALVVATLGLASMIDAVAHIAWGSNARILREPFGDKVLDLGGGVTTTVYGIAAVVVAGVVFAVAAFFFSRARAGVQMRAAAEDPVLAAQGAMRVDWLYATGWAAAFGLATIGALVYAYTTALSPGIGDTLGLRSVAPALVGGLASVRGIIPGALVVALAETYGVAWLGSQMQDVAAWLVILAILLIRPQGLFGARRVSRV